MAVKVKYFRNHPIYRAWANMKTRCYNPNCEGYKDYGGRGIKICKKWQTFQGFYQDMFNSYKAGFSLDRIDNDKGYSKSNCQWSDWLTQANNKRNNRIIEYRGIIKTLPQWARDLNIKRSTLAQRYYVYKWNIDKCLGGGLLWQY